MDSKQAQVQIMQVFNNNYKVWWIHIFCVVDEELAVHDENVETN